MKRCTLIIIVLILSACSGSYGSNQSQTPLVLSTTQMAFGENASGSSATESMVIYNTSDSPLTNMQIRQTGDVDSFVIQPQSSCPLAGSWSLPVYSACSIIVKYNAPNLNATQTSSIIISADNLPNQTVSLSATSIISTWTNLFDSVSNYTDSGAIVLSMANDVSNNLYFGNSLAPGVAGARNIWYLANGSTTLQQLSASYTQYNQSAPMALLVNSISSLYIAQYSGAVQLCMFLNCTNVIEMNSSLGVTSMVSLGASSAYVAYSDKVTGITGQLLLISNFGSSVDVITGVTGAVGKMATDGVLMYVPIHMLNRTGILSTYDINGSQVASNIAPLGLATNEFITVVFFAKSQELYIGTSMGNVYSSLTPANSSTWTKLSKMPLSTTSYVSALAFDVNDTLYAGLVNLATPTVGGGVYKLSNGNFAPSVGYTDTSSVATMLYFNGVLNVATYAGNIWQSR